MSDQEQNVQGEEANASSNPLTSKIVANMSDDEIMNMDPATLVVAENEEENAGDADGSADSAQASSEGGEQENPEGDADGAAAGEGSSENPFGSDGSTSAKETDDPDTGQSTSSEADDSPSDDQSGDKGEDGDDEGDGKSDEVDYKAEYGKLMAPFRAAKREVTLGNIEDARRLMQMGVDYSRKMEGIKPHLQVIRTLDKAGLLDLNKINFLIDLDKKEPEAIKKLLRDKGIDPMDLNLEDGEDYSPADHSVSEDEMALTDVLDNIKDSDTFERTVEVTTGMDKRSRESLRTNPEVLAVINDHMQSGVYDQVAERVASEKLFGRLKGLSDLEAYYRTGDAMFKAGELGGNPKPDTESSSTDGKTSSSSAQNSSDDPPKGKGVKDQKRAAGSPRGSTSGGKPKKLPDFSKFSDKQIEEYEFPES